MPHSTRTPKRFPKPLNVECLPPGAKVLTVFPRPTVQGIRNVPTLVNANGIPILRFSKQPANLSRVLRQKLRAKLKLRDRYERLSDLLSIAQSEDQWDELLEQRCGSDPGIRNMPSWTTEIRQSIKDGQALYVARNIKNAELAAKMQNIVEQETKLAERERLERLKEGDGSVERANEMPFAQRGQF